MAIVLRSKIKTIKAEGRWGSVDGDQSFLYYVPPLPLKYFLGASKELQKTVSNPELTQSQQRHLFIQTIFSDSKLVLFQIIHVVFTENKELYMNQYLNVRPNAISR